MTLPTPPHPDEKLSYRPSEAAKLLGVSRRYLTLAAQRGEIRPLRLSARCTLYTRESLLRWLADRTAEGER